MSTLNYKSNYIKSLNRKIFQCDFYEMFIITEINKKFHIY